MTKLDALLNHRDSCRKCVPFAHDPAYCDIDCMIFGMKEECPEGGRLSTLYAEELEREEVPK